MLTPTMWKEINFFYPIGNSTPISLTQHLSPEQSAKILLLGCGDARNVLFTCYSENPQNHRTFDITCCDVEEAIIARNIVLYTLIVDDTSNTNKDAIWDIYYHFCLDKIALKLLHSQSRKLYGLATSMQSWESSAYGKMLRFCNESSLTLVRDMWGFYAKSSASDDENGRFGVMLDMDRLGSLKWQEVTTKGCWCIDASVAPATLDGHLFPEFHKSYFEYGTTEESSTRKAKRPTFQNPMFATLDTTPSVYYYKTNPLTAFQLATAYIPMSSNSPLQHKSQKDSASSKAVCAARAQFAAWIVSFGKLACQETFTLRFIVSEALAFSHTLANAKENGSAHRYIRQYDPKPLVLDSNDYSYKSGTAPRMFNVIDTSNLADLVGIINVLVATAPLLKRSCWSSVCTELYNLDKNDDKAFKGKVLSGEFATVSALLGLFPVEYFCNASAISKAEQYLSNGRLGRQSVYRLFWKPSFSCPDIPSSLGCPIQSLSFKEDELAHFLFGIFNNMFIVENCLAFNIVPTMLMKDSMRFYHREGFVWLLRYIKNISVVQWDKMMLALLRLISGERNPFRKIWELELKTHLHLLGLYTPDFPDMRSNSNFVSKGLGAWKEIPQIVCVTLKVPRASINRLAYPPHILQCPPLRCNIPLSMGSKNGPLGGLFCSLQLSFGYLHITGNRNADNLQLHIKEDKLSWKGNSPLLVSFYVPSCIFLDPLASKIEFGLQMAPPWIMEILRNQLEPGLTIYTTDLKDQDHVFVTKHFPNHSGPILFTTIETKEDLAKPFQSKITAHILNQITAFTGRVDFVSQNLKSELSENAVVKTMQHSPHIIEVTVGEQGKHFLHFPTPVAHSRAKVAIARKSFYIEVTVPMADHTNSIGFSNHVFPIFASKAEPVLWNMPFLVLDRLPIFDISKSNDFRWLYLHTLQQFSEREAQAFVHTRTKPNDAQKDARTEFKGIIHNMFNLLTKKPQGYGFPKSVKKPSIHTIAFWDLAQGLHALIFVSGVRFDMGSKTAVLDATVVPLTYDLHKRLADEISSFSRYPKYNFQLDNDVLALWKQVLPAYIERCRTWKHLPTCEYKHQLKIPLSTKPFESFLCSCGNGSVQPDFLPQVPSFTALSKYAVRAAISPVCVVPYIEGIDPIQHVEKGQCRACNAKEKLGGGELMSCKRCKVHYCSAKCQKADWKEHKKVCKQSDAKDGEDLSSLLMTMALGPD